MVVGKIEVVKEPSAVAQMPPATREKAEVAILEWDMMGTYIRKLSFLDVEQLVAKLHAEVQARDIEIVLLREKVLGGSSAEDVVVGFRQGRELGCLEGEGHCLDRESLFFCKTLHGQQTQTARIMEEVEKRFERKVIFPMKDGESVEGARSVNISV